MADTRREGIMPPRKECPIWHRTNITAKISNYRLHGSLQRVQGSQYLSFDQMSD